LSKKKTNRALAAREDNTISFNQYVAQRKNVHLVPKSLAQEEYIDLLLNEELKIVFATGPAGTGKTMLAMLAAIKAFKEGQVQKIVMTRPAVGVDDEAHGFLPGTIEEKMAPWTRPLFDVMHEYWSPKETERMLEEQQIEISPLAYMRGRTFKGAYIVADEMQNATPSQMKMLLTRLGEGSKMVVTGDTRQADRREKDNGLLDFQQLVAKYTEQVKYIDGVAFTGKDIQRDPVVEEVLRIYKEL
jgi:phosphate starvation-inducible PhoH-like protein